MAPQAAQRWLLRQVERFLVAVSRDPLSVADTVPPFLTRFSGDLPRQAGDNREKWLAAGTPRTAR
jgi:hypothetical protein